MELSECAASTFLLSNGPHGPCELANAGSGCKMMTGLVSRERAVAWLYLQCNVRRLALLVGLALALNGCKDVIPKIHLLLD